MTRVGSQRHRKNKNAVDLIHACIHEYGIHNAMHEIWLMI